MWNWASSAHYFCEFASSVLPGCKRTDILCSHLFAVHECRTLPVSLVIYQRKLSELRKLLVLRFCLSFYQYYSLLCFQSRHLSLNVLKLLLSYLNSERNVINTAKTSNVEVVSKYQSFKSAAEINPFRLISIRNSTLTLLTVKLLFTENSVTFWSY